MNIGIRRGGAFSSKSNSRKSVKLQRAVSPLIEAMEQRMMLSASAPLTGTVIGTPGSYNNSGNTIAKVFDGNVNNYFDGPTATGNYAGLDLGTAKVITQISYAPRPGYGSRMVGGIFQGSDSADFSGALTTLYTVTSTPASNALTTVNVSSAVPFRYVRYLSPNGSYGDVGEVKFIGVAPTQGATLGSDGTLAVYGSNNADDISVTVDQDNNDVSVDINGTTQTFAYAAVTQIVVAGLGGNDSIGEQYYLENYSVAPPTTLLGGDGNDSISTNLDYAFAKVLPAIQIDGGAGDDGISVFGDGEATVHGGDGNDSIDTESVNDLDAVLYGDNGNDRLKCDLDVQNVTMYGGAGNDTFTDADYNDRAVISGGSGIDTFEPAYQSSMATLNLDGAADSSLGSGYAVVQLDTDIENINVGVLSAGPDNVMITGSSSSNVITVDGVNNVTINGGGGNDTILADDGTVVVNCGNGNNDVVVRAEYATLNGGSGNDSLTTDYNGEGGTATINGGSGDDTINAANGQSDTIDGGPDTDTAYIDSTGDTVTNVENVIGAAPTPVVLTGTVIGTPGSYNNSGNTIAKVFDGNVNNYFDGPTANGNYAGLDLGGSYVVTQIKYAPRAGYASRMVGGVFQSSSTADFSANVVTLYTVTAAPPSGAFTTVNVSNAGSYRYVRYLSPNGSYGDVAEVQFTGYAAPMTVGSTLVVDGTSSDDTIKVTFDNNTFEVTVNGTAQTYSAAGVKTLVVNTDGGDNTVTIDGNYDYGSAADAFAQISVVGGAGNDTLHTSIEDESQSSSQSMNVSFNGGDGQDVVDIEGGDTATIVEGNGSDQFYTQAIEDTLNFSITAGNGNNHLTMGSVGGSSSQYGTMNVGSGADSFNVGDPDDHLTVNVSGRNVQLTDSTAAFVGSVINQSTGAGVSGVQVFIDSNGDGIYNAGETAVTTDANGVFAFTQLTPSGSSSATIAMTLPAGYSYSPTTPTSAGVTLEPGYGASGVQFLLVPYAATGTVSGRVTTSNNAGVANAVVYLDTNNNSKLDSGELSTTTLRDGSYSFANVPSGTYIIRQVLPSGQKQTSPSNNYGIHTTVSAGSNVTNANFTDASTGTASIAGSVFNDANNNQKQDTGEAGLKSFTMYLDLSNSGSFVAGDPTATTDANGNYTFASLAAGTYIVRVETPSGYSQTTPTQNYGQHETVATGQKVTGAVFGERKIA